MLVAATVISKVFNVFTNSLAAMVVAILVQPLLFSEQLFWVLAGLISAALPLSVYFLEYKKGKISSFWSPPAKERVKAHIAWLAAAVLFGLLAFALSAPVLIFALSLVLVVIGLINLLLFSSFKISVHSETITIFVLTCILAISVQWVFLVVLIPLIGWSRVYLKAHTLLEVSVGSLTSVIVVFFIFSLFSLATF